MSKTISTSKSLYVLTIDSTLEHQLHQTILKQDNLVLEPQLTENIISSLAHWVEQMLNDRKRPILLCSTMLRRHLKQLTQRVIPHLTVLAMSEIPVNIPVESFGVVK